MSNTIRITEACSLAMHTMGLMATDPERIFATRELAGDLQCSEAHLSKVLQRLAKSGLVQPIRGPKGGFRLGGAPEEITLLAVYEVIEGPFVMGRCLMSNPICRGDQCVLGGLLDKINHEVYTHLKETNISQITDIFESLYEAKSNGEQPE